ncbi:MAG: PorT family protein [Proteobacteria bacterium]|nr:PorT family protein [Pseudomonadota bacterium]
MKTALISLLALAILLIACGSTWAAGPMKCGVKAGIVIADETYEYAPNSGEFDFDPQSRTGLALGFFIEYPLIQRLAIRPGIEYVQKGSKASFMVATEEHPEGIGTTEFQDRITYLSVPVLVSVSFPVGKSSTYLLAGPRLDFKMDSELEFITDADFNSTVFGVTAGAGQELPVKGLGTLLVEFNYHHDLGDAFEGEILTIKNKSFSVMAGFKF